MSDSENNKKKINIELDSSVADGSYCNLAIINHSVSEFVLDFVNIMPGLPKHKVKSRIILAPHHAKRLSKALIENIGTIKNIGSRIGNCDDRRFLWHSKDF